LFEHKLQRPQPPRYGGGEGGELLKQSVRVRNRQDLLEAGVVGGQVTAGDCLEAGEREQLSLVADGEDSRS
jgi:hypothetical protein